MEQSVGSASIDPWKYPYSTRCTLPRNSLDLKTNESFLYTGHRTLNGNARRARYIQSGGKKFRTLHKHSLSMRPDLQRKL